jgi:hypothetical protein
MQVYVLAKAKEKSRFILLETILFVSLQQIKQHCYERNYW